MPFFSRGKDHAVFENKDERFYRESLYNLSHRLFQMLIITPRNTSFTAIAGSSKCSVH